MVVQENIYEKLSEKRKKLQAQGEVPLWMSTAGLQLFEDKYLYQAKTFKEQITRIAKTAASYMPESEVWEKKFFNLGWNGWLSFSTPVLANMGTDRGMSVSCSGGYIPDSVDGFYTHKRETALLTKYGFGTSGYAGDIRPRGTPISSGGKASGVAPVFKGLISDMRDIAQGTARRGAYAMYIDIDHGDFDELVNHIEAVPDDANIGWVVTDEFIARLEASDPEALRRFQRSLKLKMISGKGYFFYVDKVNRKRPEMYKALDFKVLASNLCTEITLYSSLDYIFTCVLSSKNLAKYDEWTGTDSIFDSTVFLDCVAQDFITKATGIPGLEKAVDFTRKGRALGLGTCGFHTLLQQKGIPFESFEAHNLNIRIFKEIHEESLRASQWLAKELGEPEWCTGYGVRNTHRIAVAPTKSTALIMGGISEGINPDPAMIFTQTTAGGEMDRINPVFLEVMKAKGKYTKKYIQEIIDKQGSVQHVDWLTPEEKLVFKTAFEIDQRAVLRLASTRGQFIDQWQSLNLFFSADEDEAYIAQIHKEAFLDERILALYYVYTQAGVQASKDECIACQ